MCFCAYVCSWRCPLRLVGLERKKDACPKTGWLWASLLKSAVMPWSLLDGRITAGRILRGTLVSSYHLLKLPSSSTWSSPKKIDQDAGLPKCSKVGLETEFGAAAWQIEEKEKASGMLVIFTNWVLEHRMWRGGNLWDVAFADFCGVNAPNMTNFKPSKWHHWSLSCEWKHRSPLSYSTSTMQL